MARLSALPYSAVRHLILTTFACLTVQLLGFDSTAAAGTPNTGTTASLALRTAGIFEEPLVATGQTSGKTKILYLRLFCDMFFRISPTDNPVSTASIADGMFHQNF